jgi:hypothetical protein
MCTGVQWQCIGHIVPTDSFLGGLAIRGGPITSSFGKRPPTTYFSAAPTTYFSKVRPPYHVLLESSYHVLLKSSYHVLLRSGPQNRSEGNKKIKADHRRQKRWQGTSRHKRNVTMNTTLWLRPQSLWLRPQSLWCAQCGCTMLCV